MPAHPPTIQQLLDELRLVHKLHGNAMINSSPYAMAYGTSRSAKLAADRLLLAAIRSHQAILETRIRLMGGGKHLDRDQRALNRSAFVIAGAWATAFVIVPAAPVIAAKPLLLLTLPLLLLSTSLVPISAFAVLLGAAWALGGFRPVRQRPGKDRSIAAPPDPWYAAEVERTRLAVVVPALDRLRSAHQSRRAAAWVLSGFRPVKQRPGKDRSIAPPLVRR